MNSRIRRDPILVPRVRNVALCGTVFYLELRQLGGLVKNVLQRPRTLRFVSLSVDAAYVTLIFTSVHFFDLAYMYLTQVVFFWHHAILSKCMDVMLLIA